MCGTCSDHFVLPATFRFRALEFLARDCVSAAGAGSAHTERSPAGVAAAGLDAQCRSPFLRYAARDTQDPVAGPQGPSSRCCRRRRVRQRALRPRAGGVFLDAAAVAAHSRFRRRGRRRVAADAGAAAGAAADAAAARGAAGASSAPPSPTLAPKPVGRQRPSAHRRVRLPGHGDAVHRAAAARCVPCAAPPTEPPPQPTRRCCCAVRAAAARRVPLLCTARERCRSPRAAAASRHRPGAAAYALLPRVARRHRRGAAAYSPRRALCVAAGAAKGRRRSLRLLLGAATRAAPQPTRRRRAFRVAAERCQRAAPQPTPAVRAARGAAPQPTRRCRRQRAAPQPTPAVGRRHRGGATAHALLTRAAPRAAPQPTTATELLIAPAPLLLRRQPLMYKLFYVGIPL